MPQFAKFSAIGMVLLSVVSVLKAAPAVIVERFDAEPGGEWTATPAAENTDGELDWKPGEPGLWFTTPRDAVSPGMLVRPWPIGEEPFEVTWRAELVGGDGMGNRSPSIHVALTTAPPDDMKPREDLAIVMGVGNPGVSAGVRRGPLYQLNQNREGHPPLRSRWQDEWLPGGLIGGMTIANVGWYDNVLANQTVTVRMRRTAEGKLQFTAWHHDIGLETHWWQAEQDVPKELANKPLTHLVIMVSPAPRGHPFHGPQSRVRGWLKDLQVRPLSAPRPWVTGIEPAGSVAAPGGELTIIGEQFGDAARVTVGGQDAPVVRSSDTELTVTLPDLDMGMRHVLEVHHASGTVGRWAAGVPYGRVLEAVKPREVHPDGGDEVTLFGAGFGSHVKVTINGRPAEVLQRIDSTRLRLRTPAAEKPGPAKVVVTENDQPFSGDPLFGYAPHPYIMHHADQIEKIRSKFNSPVLATWRQVIMTGADAEEDLTRMGGPDAGNRPYYPWIAYLMTGKREYRDKLMAILEVICAQRDHHQFQIQKAVSVAVVYDSLFQELSPDERQMMIEYLDRSLDQYLDRTGRNDWWFANNPSNTITVGANGGLHAALALMHSRADDAKKAIDTGVRLIHERYHGIADDGSSIEGTLYWDYGLSQQVILGHALRSALGDDRGLLESPRIENAIHFAKSQIGGAGFMFVNNNTQPFMTGVVIAADAGSRYNQPLMRWLADHVVYLQSLPPFEHPDRKRVGVFTRPQFIASAFFYRDETPSPTSPPDLPTIARLDAAQWATLRSAPAMTGPLVLNIKGHAGPLAHHKQPDKGNFQLHARGDALIITPGYYSSQPTDLSIPLIDGKAGDAEADTAAPITDLWEDGDIRGASINATAPYAKTAKARRVVRHFVMIGDETVIVLDDIVPAEGAEGRITVQWQAHFPASVADGLAVITGDAAALHIQPHGSDVSLEVEGPRDFGRSWVYRHWQKQNWVQWHSVRGTYTADPAAPLVTVLQVTEPGAKAPASRVARNGNVIRVEAASGRHVEFEFGESGWELRRP
jgi:hypothetical protein